MTSEKKKDDFYRNTVLQLARTYELNDEECNISQTNKYLFADYEKRKFSILINLFPACTYSLPEFIFNILKNIGIKVVEGFSPNTVGDAIFAKNDDETLIYICFEEFYIPIPVIEFNLMPNDKKDDTVFVAHDIEKAGALLSHPIVSVGFYIGDAYGGKLETFQMNIKVKWPEAKDYGDFEPRCWDNFWSKLSEEVKENITKDALEPEEAWFKIKEWLVGLESKYSNIKFLTDNASFDSASIDYCLEKYCKSMPMRYSTKGAYRSIISADDKFEMLPSKLQQSAYEEIKKQVNHDHNPVNDAHYIYLLYHYSQKLN